MNLREAGAARGETFEVFQAVALRIGVYTGQDYLEILEHLIDSRKIGYLTGISPEAQKEQEYICTLLDRYRRILRRARIPSAEELPADFRWSVSAA